MTLRGRSEFAHIGAVPNDPTSLAASPKAEAGALTCPVCGGAVDPRRTTQAISRNKRLMLFCSSGCLRQFLASERGDADKEPTT